jgi:D-beta-D-heptose 7-phosphate kinase/D-beta-D-heptose 1-phosphate adenosyltransferase
LEKNLFKNPSVSLLDALSFRNKAKKENKTFVLTNGCFDLLHSGHVFSLIEASKLGDYLWVAINSDSSIKNLKGAKRPIINEIDRAYLLTSLACVAGVTIFNSTTLVDEILLLKPDI